MRDNNNKSGLARVLGWASPFVLSVASLFAQENLPKNGDEFTISRNNKGTITYRAIDNKWSYRTNLTTKENHWIPTKTPITYDGKILTFWKESQPTLEPEPDPEPIKPEPEPEPQQPDSLEQEQILPPAPAEPADTSKSVEQVILDLEQQRLATEIVPVDTVLVEPEIQLPAAQSTQVDSPLVKPETTLKPKTQPKPPIKPKIKPTIAEGVQAYLTSSYNEYLETDAVLYRALKKGVKNLRESIGDLKTLDDDKHKATKNHIKYLKKSLENAVDSSGILFMGEAGFNKAEETTKYLRDLQEVYQGHLETTIEGLEAFNEELQNSATLSGKLKRKLKKKGKEIEGKITELENIVNILDNTAKYAEDNIKDVRGFGEPEEFEFSGDDDFQNLSKFLVNTYQTAEREFEGQEDLFRSWFEGSYKATVLVAMGQAKDILKNDYVDPKDFERVMNEYGLGDGIIEDIEDEKELLRRTTKLFGDLSKGKLPKGSKTKPYRVRKTSRSHRHAEKPIEFIIGGGGNKDAYNADFGLRVGPVSGIASINNANNKNIFEETTPTSGNGVYGFTSIDKINYKPSLGLALEANLGRFLLGVGRTSWNYTDQAIQNQMKDGSVTKPHSYSGSESDVSTNIYGGVGFGPKDGSKLYLLAGHDGEMGGYAKLRLNLRLNNKPRSNIGKRGK